MNRDDFTYQVTFGSACSGIEAASAAWHPLGWRAEWLAEIEPFPARVLNHHYGAGRPLHMPSPHDRSLSLKDVDARRAAIKAVSTLPDTVAAGAPRNLGDMTKVAALVRAGIVSCVAVLVGGTPCQAFSIAGLRNSLGDARGQLTLAFVDLANANDAARHVRGEPAGIIVWENVPGVLNTPDNAFGCFLGALAGEDSPLVALGGKWPNAGCVYGPQRTVAWRVLDAQYFGVAQRRRRVFVVASARDDIDPTEILFEFDGVRRDFAPSRQTAEDLAGTVRASAARRGGVQDECGLGLQPVAAPITRSVERPRGDGVDTLIAFSSKDYGADSSVDLAPTLRAGNHHTSHANGGQPPAIAFVQNSRDEVRLMAGDGQIVGALAAETGAKQQCYIAQCITGCITHTLKAEGFDASEDGTGRGQPIVAHSVRLANTSSNGWGIQEEVAHTLDRTAGPAVHHHTAVRRLTPRECERLQSFPDDHTLIPIRPIKQSRAEALLAKGDPAVLIGEQWWAMSLDGPRYKALGNSMCVYNMRWIGRRIADALARAAVAPAIRREIAGRAA